MSQSKLFLDSTAIDRYRRVSVEKSAFILYKCTFLCRCFQRSVQFSTVKKDFFDTQASFDVEKNVSKTLATFENPMGLDKDVFVLFFSRMFNA